MEAKNHSFPFWSFSKEEVLKKLNSSLEGLSMEEAHKRDYLYRKSFPKGKKKRNIFYLLLSQFNNPLIFLLMFAAILSGILSDRIDAFIILIIIVFSGLLGFFQENKAMNAVEKLLHMVKVKVTVIRAGKEHEVDVDKVVAGDIVLFNAGDIIPGDSLLLESKDFYVDESSLTGESFSVEKKEGLVDKSAPLRKRSNTLFYGSHVISGTAKAVVCLKGKETEFGKIAERLNAVPPKTDFEKGIKKFGYFLLKITFILVLAIFAINALFARPILESFLFALALAVGLVPQLLPAVISVNLAHGASRMAKAHVIVKKLNSIENFGSMKVLCVDKTGTLTQGKVEFKEGVDAEGNSSDKVRLFAFLNAFFQTGYSNPLDAALLKNPQEKRDWEKKDELPYDFRRKKISMLVEKKGERLILTKGSFQDILHICTSVEMHDGRLVSIKEVSASLESHFKDYVSQGMRVLGIAYKQAKGIDTLSAEQEKEMIFLGFLLFFDPLKPKVVEAIEKIEQLGISLKIITGDHHLVALYVAKQLGLSEAHLLTGEEITGMSEHELHAQVNKKNVFAEIEPQQKERIILALKKTGRVVGFVGDGINDSIALHAADVGISVDSGADVAKEVADIILLKKDLSVLAKGVEEGRRTFANTLKYIFMATSANFGNMFSMALSSFFLSFLPLLPKQILLNNLMTDCAEMTIATDKVDPEMKIKPLKWDLTFIRKFMIVFGLISSVFDILTFITLMFIFHASVDQLRTAWFIESVLSAAFIILMVRSRRPFYRSLPSWPLLTSVLAVSVVTIFLPFTPFIAKMFNFTELSFTYFLAIAIIVTLYILSVEIAKKFFYPHNHLQKNSQKS